MRKGKDFRSVLLQGIAGTKQRLPEENEELEKEIAEYVNQLPALKYEGHTGQLENVITAIETDTLPAIGGEDGRRTIELITAIYLSGSFGQTVELPLTKDSPFYTVDGIMKTHRISMKKPHPSPS